ncbi:MAG: heme exporter protein CcmB [Myxococcota bacterium]|nr:heme exporter protein CcmB [Myxococcota bacterium]MDW8360806.1 heme exporter protein CcmB [Myxococcales bacterium]
MIRDGRAALAIAAKDLRAELRGKQVLTLAVPFAALLAVLASLAFYVDRSGARMLAPGVMWLTIAFVGVVVVGRAYDREREWEAGRALLVSPVSRGALWAGKTLAAFLLVLLVELVLVPLVAVFFHVELLSVIVPLAGLLVLGTAGFVAPTSLFGALGMRRAGHDALLALVVFPLVAPVLLGAAVATRELLDGASWDDLRGWLALLAAADVLHVAAGLLAFGPLVED